MEIKPLSNEQIELVNEFIEKATPGKDCLFCTGRYTCRCGSCPEEEYHAEGCPVLLFMIIRGYWRRNEPAPNLVLEGEMDWYRKRVKELEDELGSYTGDTYVPSKFVGRHLDEIEAKLDQLLASKQESMRDI